MFDPFSSADFSRSQQPEQKYGIAHAFLDAALRCEPANGKLLPTFDIRHGSAKRLVAYWVTVVHRVRCEGSGMFVSLHTQSSLTGLCQYSHVVDAVFYPTFCKRLPPDCRTG
jgi:hypothetical protein